MNNKQHTRQESDSIGTMQIAHEQYWGAQTQRALENFNIGTEKMPLEVISALAVVKLASAKVNFNQQLLSAEKLTLITDACNEIISGKLNNHFPLNIWQTGSGTQTNMNVNEVIANRANEIYGNQLGTKSPIHPNDDVNMSQSSNDSFPTAMHLAAIKLIDNKLIPNITKLINGLQKKSLAFNDIVKIGRTHLQDAVPLTLGQEFSGYVTQLEYTLNNIKITKNDLYSIAQGGTAVGSGTNTPKQFDLLVAKEIATITNLPITSTPNKFAALAAHDPIIAVSAAIKNCAIAMIKIANDIRWLGSGPRCAIGELILPANEPGSSIMPGKVNPTQCEAMIMLCTQIIGNDTSIAIANSQGNFELNVSKPLIIYNLINSIHLLADGCSSFNDNCIKHLKANYKKIHEHLQQSLMLVTALAPKLGYDKAAEIAKTAYELDLTLKAAAIKLNYISAEEFEQIVQPKNMIKK